MNALPAVHAGKEDDIPAGDTKIVKAGSREILVVNTGSGIYALDNSCIHGGCRLSNGRLDEETLYCPCHGSVFSVVTGAVINGPASVPQPVHAVTVRNGEIIIAPRTDPDVSFFVS